MGCCGFTRMSGVASPKPKMLPGAQQQRSRRSTSIGARHGAGDGHPPSERVALRAALRWSRQHSRCRLIRPHRRAGEGEPQGSAEAPDPTAAVTWSEEQPLELATSLPAMRTIRQRTFSILKKLLQHHTRCHHQRTKRRDSESLQAEVAAARWAWLGPTLLVRAYEGSGHADDEGLTPGDEAQVEH